MALSTADLATIEFWTGEILPEDEEKLDGLLGLYGSPYAVALHVLHADLAEFSRSPESVSAGTDREAHGRNVDWLTGQIGRLVLFVRGSDSISPGEAFEALLGGLEAGGPEYLVEIPTVAVNARRA